MHITPVSLKNYSFHNFLNRSKDIVWGQLSLGSFSGRNNPGAINPGGQFSSGAIIRRQFCSVAIFLGGNCPRGNYRGGGAIFLREIEFVRFNFSRQKIGEEKMLITEMMKSSTKQKLLHNC